MVWGGEPTEPCQGLVGSAYGLSFTVVPWPAEGARPQLASSRCMTDPGTVIIMMSPMSIVAMLTLLSLFFSWS